jgi:hypothetical protein
VETALRLARVLVGIAISSVSFLVIVHAHLGTGPWHVVQQGIAARLHVELGTAVWISGLCLFFGALATGERPGVATLAAMFLGGVYVNLLGPYVGDLDGESARLASLLVATVAMTFGGALYMSVALGTCAIDARVSHGRRLHP